MLARCWVLVLGSSLLAALGATGAACLGPEDVGAPTTVAYFSEVLPEDVSDDAEAAPPPTTIGPDLPTIVAYATGGDCSADLSLARAGNLFLAPTMAEATAVAQAIDFLPESRWEHPSNMCGPLAAAILLATCRLPEGPTPHSFWLSNPEADGRPASLFPSEDYEVTRVREAAGRYDFAADPLQEGDFLYLFSGRSGTFSHMIVVTEVDPEGRAYSVSNLGHRDGTFTIERILLFDPLDETLGYLRGEWATGYFRTGQGGFIRIRPAASVESELPPAEE